MGGDRLQLVLSGSTREVKSTMEQAFGFLAVHELVSYQPVLREKLVSIDVQYPLSPLISRYLLGSMSPIRDRACLDNRYNSGTNQMNIFRM